MKKCMAAVEAACDVVVLTYGSFDRLERTLRSVAEQDCLIGTLVLSDDGSGKPFPCAALKLLETLLQKARLARLIVRANTENQGTVSHLNTTAALCTGEYIKFLSCGDAFDAPSSLRTLVAFGRKHGAPIVSSAVMVCDETLARPLYPYPQKGRVRLLQKKAEQVFPSLCVQNILSAVGCLFHRDFFTVYGGFDTAYRLLEDWPVWLRLTREGVDIPVLSGVICRYGVGGVSSQSGNAYLSAALRQDMLLCYRKEILPYCDRLGFIKKHMVGYYYHRLLWNGSWRLWLRYPYMQLLFCSKATLKNILIILRG